MEDIKNYIGNSFTCIHCPTFEEAEKINALLLLAGCSGLSGNLSTHWNTYKENSVIYTEKRTLFADVKYAKSENNTIIPASSFLGSVVNNSYSIF